MDLKHQENAKGREKVRKHFDSLRKLDREQRREKGREYRGVLPRKAHGTWEVSEDRRDVVGRILEQEKTRLPDLVELRHERMAMSPFAFYRGAAVVMARDLATQPNTDMYVQLCGDAHVGNFGMFSSMERHLVFDINDFDETTPGPWEWDLKRLAASLEILGRERGFSAGAREDVIRRMVKRYRQSMWAFSDMGALDVWYEHLNVDELYEATKEKLGKKQGRVIQETLEKAHAKNSTRAIRKLTELVDGRIRVKYDPPIVIPVRMMDVDDDRITESIDLLQEVWRKYRKTLPRERRSLIDRYSPMDIAQKVVGVGSVGLEAWILVLEGDGGQDDPLVLQIKEARASVLEEYTGKSDFVCSGQRVVQGQKAVQTAGDILLGWAEYVDPNGKKKDYYIRQLWDGKGGFDLDEIGENGVGTVARMCAWTLAHAHAKTGDRHVIAGYMGKGKAFDKAIVKFARRYADQNERDYETFLKMI